MLDEIESDFSVYHRIDDVLEMDGPRFLRLVARIGAYGGAVARRWQQVRQSQVQEPAATPRAVVSSDASLETMRNEARRKAHPRAGGEIQYVSLREAMKVSTT
jgi:hypothetical protein